MVWVALLIGVCAAAMLAYLAYFFRAMSRLPQREEF
jgi:hypothetical protein